MANQPQLSGLSLVPDISKANFYNADEGNMANLQKAQEDALAALQQRYAQPNWFNVAAGFLKPQLGGFTASLGSASQAMGENLENQRASELTAAQMRSQIALTKMAVTQKQKAAAMAAELAKKPGGVTAQDVADITNTDPERGVVAQQLLKNEQDTRKEILDLHATGRTDAELEAIYGPKFNQLYPNGTKNLPKVPSAAPVTSAAVQVSAQNVDKPPIESGLTQSQWDILPLKKKNDIVDSIAGTNQENIKKSEDAFREPAVNAPVQISNLRSMRELALYPGMEKVFNVLGGDDLLSLVGKGISEGRLTDRLASLEPILRQANITDPDLRRNAAQLAKLINEQKLSGNNANTTDDLRNMQVSANPSFDNPQTAFVNLTDAIAHTQRRHIDLWKMQQGNNPEKQRLNAYQFIGSPMWNKYNEDFSNEHRNILLKPPSLQTPSDIYDLTPRGISVSVPDSKSSESAPAAVVPANRSSVSSGSVRPAENAVAPAKLGRSAIQAEIERRAALKKP
jgi:hypothetical protein